MKPGVETIAAMPAWSRGTGPVGAPRSTGLALTGLCLTMLMPSVATSIVNAALPELAGMFDATFQGAQWILLIYLLAITTAVIVAGRLGDLIGRRRVFIAGIAGFTFASLMCGVAPTLPLLIAARGLQGLGAAMMMALTMAFVGDIIPKERIGAAMGLLGTMSAVGTTLGPSLGGLLLGFAGWPAIFLINVPIGIVALLLARVTLPTDGPRARMTPGAFDLPGMALLLLTLGAYAAAMTIGRADMGWLSAGLFCTALVACAGFIVVESKARAPLIRLTIFGDRALRSGLIASVLISAVMMTTLVVGPFYLSRVFGLRAAILGLALSVGPLVAAFVGLPAGRLVDRFGSDRVGICGLFAILTGVLGLSLVPAALGTAGYVLPILTMTGGYAIFQTANNSGVMAAAVPAQRGVVSAMLNLARNLGLVTGASAMGAVFASGVGSDIVTAQPVAIATGMHIAFAVGSGLAVLALIVTIDGLRRQPKSIC